MGRRRAGTYLGVLIVAGSLTSLVAEYLLCRWPAPHSLSLAAAFLAALTYVSAAVLSGLAATWFFWARSRMRVSSSLSLFALTSAVGWIWIPSVVLLSRQRSIGAALVGAMAAALMAIGLRKVLTPDVATLHQNSPGWKTEGRELFTQSLLAPSREGHAFFIALCIYGGFYALHKHAFLVASILLALSTFLLAWKSTLASDGPPGKKGSHSRPALRLAREGLTAVLLTTAVLLLDFQRGIYSNAMDAASAPDRSSVSRYLQQKSRPGNSAAALSGYESIILWPVPQKKKLLAPTSSGTSSQAVRMTKPLVIRFDGPYWYFRPPRKSPGSRAHVVHGTPLAVSIHSTDFVPLLMEARQTLGAAIPLTCCREIQVTIENHDNVPGRIAIGVLLTDSTSIGKPTLYLDQQPVMSTEPDHFSVKSSPVQEVLRFSVPSHPRIDRFDEITVIFFPDTERAKAAAKIAIQEFELLPR
jgi:hypothetical protein